MCAAVFQISFWLRLLGTLLVGLALGVPTYACDGKYCARVDFGSCGNACCKVEWEVHQPAWEVMHKLNESLHTGGPDGGYSANILAHGGTGFTTSRPGLPDPPYYIGQGTHTSRVELYRDTLNFAIYSPSPERSTITAFSISNIGAALIDQGQNYSNLEELAKAMGFKFRETLLLGCGKMGFETSSSGMLGLIIASQLFFMVVPIFKMQSFFGSTVVQNVVRAASLMAFLLLCVECSMPSSDAHSALPLVIFNLSLRVVEPIFYFAMKGGGLKTLLGYPTGNQSSQYDQI